MKKIFFLLIFSATMVSCSESLVLPTDRQVEWADAELGVMFHLDLPCFEGYDQNNPDASIFNPTQLSTDQWVQTAKEMGAKYIVMIAKHGTGFCLWPTDAYECSVKNSPWKNGRGDIIGDFIASCKKYDIKPALYYCTHCNDYCGMDHHRMVGKMTLEEYNEIVRKQLTELWSNYGELFEVWFDGGLKPVSEGGIDVKPLLEELQPNAVAFQGPKGYAHLIRWVGNEDGMAPDPCWSTTENTTSEDGTETKDGLNGTTKGKIWCPGESDCTLRTSTFNGCNWMFKYGFEQYCQTFSVEELMKKYETSVGRNTNMLIGLVIDNRGLVPESDVQRAREFGKEIIRRYGTPFCSTKGTLLKFDRAAYVDRCIIQEDIRRGERILSYILEGQTPEGEWIQLWEGENIGHKRIIRFEAKNLNALKLNVTSSLASPKISNFSVFMAE